MGGADKSRDYPKVSPKFSLQEGSVPFISLIFLSFIECTFPECLVSTKWVPGATIQARQGQSLTSRRPGRKHKDDNAEMKAHSAVRARERVPRSRCLSQESILLSQKRYTEASVRKLESHTRRRMWTKIQSGSWNMMGKSKGRSGI